MKKAFIFFVLAVMVLVSGCAGNSEPAEGYSVNMFNDENAVTVVSGNLSYSIPGAVVDQYDEKYKDSGFELPVFQAYEIPSFGEIKIYAVNLYYNNEASSNIGDLGTLHLEAAVKRSEMGLFKDDWTKKLPTVDNVEVEAGYDLYMHTSKDAVDTVASLGYDMEESDERYTMFSKGLSTYLISYKAEKGCYNEEIYQTFVNSIKFVSLEDY